MLVQLKNSHQPHLMISQHLHWVLSRCCLLGFECAKKGQCRAKACLIWHFPLPFKEKVYTSFFCGGGHYEKMHTKHWWSHCLVIASRGEQLFTIAVHCSVWVRSVCRFNELQLCFDLSTTGNAEANQVLGSLLDNIFMQFLSWGDGGRQMDD